MLDNYLRKYFIMGSQNCYQDPVNMVERALQAGITAFQYREKGDRALKGKEKIELGRKLRALCRKYHVPFLINDDVELATELDVDGIHVGQDDIPIDELRIQFPNLLLGLSVSNEEELKHSPIHFVDYIGAGPIFPTNTKDDAKQAVGVEWIRELRQRHPYLPIVGIGGINTDNARTVLEAGANGIAVISTITQAQDIKKAIAKL